MGVTFSQPPLTRVMVVLTKLLFLADLAGDGALYVADNALAAFDLGADNAETVEGHDGLLGLLRLLRSGLRLSGGVRILRCGLIGLAGDGIDVDVERGHVHVGLDGGVGARRVRWSA